MLMKNYLGIIARYFSYLCLVFCNKTSTSKQYNNWQKELIPSKHVISFTDSLLDSPSHQQWL